MDAVKVGFTVFCVHLLYIPALHCVIVTGVFLFCFCWFVFSRCLKKRDGREKS